MAKLLLQLNNYRLTTAEILYHMPDHPGLLQSFIWQELDLAPKFPQLKRFLDFWSRELDGKLHSVRVASQGLITPAEVRMVGAELVLH
ncbi:usg protein [Indioceanicola profundi]|uniref:usg protein n=1 Tax=Indioceanicola profundi TaxID=2220096 RepID=UPI000E6ACCB6|nr:usg protein [Indioceanicola profundi]